MSIPELARAFVAPNADLPVISRMVAQKWARRVRSRLEDLLGDRRSTGELDALAGFGAPRHTEWRPEIGIAARLCAQSRPALAALQFAVACAPVNRSGTLVVELPRPAHVLIDGWRVPVSGTVTLQCDDQRLRLESGSGEVDFDGSRRAMRPLDESTAGPWPVTATATGRTRYLIHSRLPAAFGIFPSPTGNQTAPSAAIAGATRKASANFRRTMARLGRSAPDYAEWLATVIDGVMLVADMEDAGVSSGDYPGLAACGHQLNEISCAETLVVQASQQLLFQLLLALPLVDGASEEIHYLPSRRIYVTTRRALANAHEHVNAIRMLRQLATDPRLARAAHRRAEHRLLQFHTECVPVLSRSKSLSDGGRAMWAELSALAGT